MVDMGNREARIARKRKARQRKIRRWCVLLLLIVLILILCRACHDVRSSREDPEEEVAVQAIVTEVEPEEDQEEFEGDYGVAVGFAIDTSGFVDPTHLNNLDLVDLAQQALKQGWGYVWGTYGDILTETSLSQKLTQYPEDVGEYEQFIRDNWLGRRTVDCIGLLKAYCWLDPETGVIGYRTDLMPDVSTETLFEDAVEKGTIDTIPEILGLIVYQKANVGIYIGDGYVIEAQGTETGVVKDRLEDRDFTYWLKCPYIVYYYDT